MSKQAKKHGLWWNVQFKAKDWGFFIFSFKYNHYINAVSCYVCSDLQNNHVHWHLKKGKTWKYVQQTSKIMYTCIFIARDLKLHLAAHVHLHFYSNRLKITPCCSDISSNFKLQAKNSPKKIYTSQIVPHPIVVSHIGKSTISGVYFFTKWLWVHNSS
jgi:hypothetical protein